MTCGIWRFFWGVPPLDSHDESPNYLGTLELSLMYRSTKPTSPPSQQSSASRPCQTKRSKNVGSQTQGFGVGLFINQQKNRGGVRIGSSFQWLKDMYCISQAVARVQEKKV